MKRLPSPPEGFRIAESAGGVLLARSDLLEDLQRAGLQRIEGWQQRLDSRGANAKRGGRGVTAVIDLAGGMRLRLKQLRRGGATARIWRERFVGARRLLDNLRVPLLAARRGVTTPAPVALLLRPGPGGLFRGWLALEEIDGATSLATRFSTNRPPTRAELEAALAAVQQMHDAGVDHRDLNLGNLLVAAGDPPRAYVIDLDGARLHSGPLDYLPRQRALRRLERSYVKICGQSAAARVRDRFYEIYAAGNPRLAIFLERGRRAGRGWISIHRLGWRR